jgi:hypothetical protein
MNGLLAAMVIEDISTGDNLTKNKLKTSLIFCTKMAAFKKVNRRPRLSGFDP